MGKRLPYFQFEPGAYFAKDIQLCSMAAQGLFINICAIYWQRECELTLTQIKKRFNHPELLQELLDEKIINLQDDKVIITFLDNQFEYATETSSGRSEAGKKSAELKKIRKELLQSLEYISLNTSTPLTKLEQEYNITSTNVEFLLQQKSTIKIREDKIRKDKGDEVNEFIEQTHRKKLNEMSEDEKELYYSNPPANENLNDIGIDELSHYMLYSEQKQMLFSQIYPGQDYKVALEKFYKHRMIGDKLHDSFKNYSSHFFNTMKKNIL